MSLPIGINRDLFLLEEPITYLNCANMSPMLKTVRDAGLEALTTRATPWKITGPDWFSNAEILRSYAAQIYQVTDDHIALVPSASYGLATAAKNCKLAAGKSVIVLENQFPSNFYVWKEMADRKGSSLIVIPKEGPGTLTDRIVQAIDNNTGIVTIPNCHWTDGKLIDLGSVSKATKAVGAYLVLDLSQSLGALPVDIETIDPDFAVAVGYKWLLGPYGLSYMYVAQRWHDTGEPLEYSWLTRKGSEDFSKLSQYNSEYRPGARKFDMGGYSQFNLLPMAIAALKQITDWGVANIQSNIQQLTALIETYKNSQGIASPDPVAGHFTGIPLKNINADVLKKKLSDNRIIISFRGTSIRVSPHVYNTTKDITRLLECFS